MEESQTVESPSKGETMPPADTPEASGDEGGNPKGEMMEKEEEFKQSAEGVTKKNDTVVSIESAKQEVIKSLDERPSPADENAEFSETVATKEDIIDGNIKDTRSTSTASAWRDSATEAEDAENAHSSIDLPPSNTQAEENARLQAELDLQERSEEEARLMANQEDARRQNHDIASQQGEEEARFKAEEDQQETRLRMEEQSRKMAEEEAQMKATREEERLEAEANARKMAEEEARLKAEQEIERMRKDEETQESTRVDEEFGQVPAEILKEAQIETTSQIAKPTLDTSEKGEDINHEQQVKDQNENSRFTEEKLDSAPTPIYSDPSPTASRSSRVSFEEPSKELDPSPTASRSSGISFAEAFGGKPTSTPKSNSSAVSFASAFGGESDTSTTISRSSGISFAEAFGGESRPISPLASPDAQTIAKKKEDSDLDQSPDAEMDRQSDTSLTAFGAAKSKRVSGLLSKYLDTASKEALPGDSIKLESSAKSPTFHPTPTPKPVNKGGRKSQELKPKSLPKIGSIRAKFEESAKNSKSNVFEFGEAFRQKQRFSIMAEKQSKKKAQVDIHGFDDMMQVDAAKSDTQVGEIDGSSLQKSFIFTTGDELAPEEWVCKVDYENTDYYGMVFVVHRTRGMMLLHHYDDKESSCETRIPGGLLHKDEFLKAARKSGRSEMQLQLAAREGAARQLYETTGIDMRKQLDRLTPAVLRTGGQADAKATQYLRNEHENKLYYFLQVDEDDFVTSDSKEKEDALLAGPQAESGSDLKLKLSGGFSDFAFVRNPSDAKDELKENGDPSATAALSMIMELSTGVTAQTYEQKPIKNESEQKHSQEDASLISSDWAGSLIMVTSVQIDSKDTLLDDESPEVTSQASAAQTKPQDHNDGATSPSKSDEKKVQVHENAATSPSDQDITTDEWEGIATRNDDEADLQQKPSTDSANQQEVATCCCGIWW